MFNGGIRYDSDEYKEILKRDGGQGSGNWGHVGVPGKRGGSAPGGGYKVVAETGHAMGNVKKQKGSEYLTSGKKPSDRSTGKAMVGNKEVEVSMPKDTTKIKSGTAPKDVMKAQKGDKYIYTIENGLEKRKEYECTVTKSASENEFGMVELTRDKDGTKLYVEKGFNDGDFKPAKKNEHWAMNPNAEVVTFSNWNGKRSHAEVVDKLPKNHGPKEGEDNNYEIWQRESKIVHDPYNYYAVKKKHVGR